MIYLFKVEYITLQNYMSSTWNAKIYSDIVCIEINAKYAKKVFGK